MFERFTDRATARRGPRPRRSEDAQPQLHRDRAHPARADPRGRGRRREGARVPEHLAGGRPLPGRGDHRPGPGRSDGPHPVHAPGQEGPGALAPRGAAARTQLHRHRAHPARPDPRGRGRRRPGPAEARRRPQPRPPAGHPAPVRLHGRQGRGPARRAGPAGLHGPRPVRPEPHPAGPRVQARPGHRAREGDRAGHAGPVPPDQEQPGADRRARRGQDRHRRGPRHQDREGRGARDAEGQADLHAGPRRPGRRLALPRRLRGAPEEGPEGDQDPRRHRAVHRRAAHAGRAPARPRARSTRPRS